MDRHAAGFTMIELVTVLIILGILAAVALPRLDTTAFRSEEFRDQIVSALRYAQKSATSHRRMVCVTFGGVSSLTLTIDQDRNGACDGQALNLPSGSNSVVSTGGVFSSNPSNFFFQPDGRATSNAGGTAVTSPTFNFVGGAAPITVSGGTGYVQ